MEDELMKQIIKPIFSESQETYGSRRLKASLKKVGISTSRRRVSRLMKEEGIVPKQVKKWHPRTTQSDEKHEKAPNILAQDFSAERANQKWVVDITYIATKEGWLYLAVILDLFSRAIVGWSMQKRMTNALVMKAWKMACAWRHPPEEMLHHSDLGSQYTSKAYLDLLREKNCQISMSRKGNCYDNACIEVVPKKWTQAKRHTSIISRTGVQNPNKSKRQYTEEFKSETVALIKSSGKSQDQIERLVYLAQRGDRREN